MLGKFGTQAKKHFSIMSSTPESRSEVIVVLGSENLEDGSLSPMAAARCEEAVKLHLKCPQAPIVLTGGHGEFNPSQQAHAFWLQAYMIQRGIPFDRTVPLEHCHHTVADLAAVRQYLLNRGMNESASNVTIHIATSDYHRLRSQLIASALLPQNTEVTFHEAPTILDDPQKCKELIAHEARRIAELLEQGGVRWQGSLHKFDGRALEPLAGGPGFSLENIVSHISSAHNAVRPLRVSPADLERPSLSGRIAIPGFQSSVHPRVSTAQGEKRDARSRDGELSP